MDFGDFAWFAAGLVGGCVIGVVVEYMVIRRAITKAIKETW